MAETESETLIMQAIRAARAGQLQEAVYIQLRDLILSAGNLGVADILTAAWLEGNPPLESLSKSEPLDHFVHSYYQFIFPALSAGSTTDEIYKILCKAGMCEEVVQEILPVFVKIHHYVIESLNKNILLEDVVNQLSLNGIPEKSARTISEILYKTQFVSIEECRSDTELYNEKYIPFIKSCLADRKVFSNFKAHPEYDLTIRTQTYKEYGNWLVYLISANTPEFFDIMDQFKINDRVGGGYLHDHKVIGRMNPGTLRYIKVCSDLFVLFGDTIKTVAEIGCAYGGQFLVMDQFFKMKEYHMFDLPPVLQLISEYLESHLLHSSYKNFTLNQHSGDVDYDLVVSNLAFSEVPVKTQLKYIKKVLSRSKRGYLTMNTGNISLDGIEYYGPERERLHLSLDKILELLPPCEVINDTTQPFVPGQYVVVWGNERSATELSHTFLRLDLISKSVASLLNPSQIEKARRDAAEWPQFVARLNSGWHPDICIPKK
ncbi:MAG: hypothetical protein H7839_07375 [Magnetococcus sp. YQC-5]